MNNFSNEVSVQHKIHSRMSRWHYWTTICLYHFKKQFEFEMFWPYVRWIWAVYNLRSLLFTGVTLSHISYGSWSKFYLSSGIFIFWNEVESSEHPEVEAEPNIARNKSQQILIIYLFTFDTIHCLNISFYWVWARSNGSCNKQIPASSTQIYLMM